MRGFEGRVIVITGAAGGIGRAVVRKWLDVDARVIGVDATESACESLSREIPGVHSVIADLTTEEGADGMMESVSRLAGPPDTLIHLVGGFAMGAIDGPNATSNWDRMMALNLTTTFHAFRVMTPVLKKRGGGWLVAMGSKAAEAPPGKMGAYVASKSGLIAFAKSLSEELKGDGIHVNVILPSTVDTPANRSSIGEGSAHKWVKAEDIADATMFLCSDRAGALFGTTLEVYGLS